MDTKLYVGNLPFSAAEKDLETLFSQAGNVTSVVIIKDRSTGRSKGFGFVEMSSQADVEEAIRMFNGHSMEGRDLKVSIARPKEEQDRGPRRSGGGGFGGGDRRRGGEGRGDRQRRDRDRDY